MAVLLNVSLDHKSMEELRELFGDFLAQSASRAVNLDDAEARALAEDARRVITFGIETTRR